jgi:fibronectin type 3 domain-containing protein
MDRKNGSQWFDSFLFFLMVLFAALAQLGCAGSSGVGVQPPQQPTTYTVKLEWIESTSPVIGYNVYRGTESGGPYVSLSSSLVTGTQYEDSNVQPGQTYYYVVTAVDSSNVESTYSNQASATIP